MTDEELKKKCTERAKIFQQAMESCHSSSPIDCIEWFADRVAELEDKLANADYQLEGRDNEIAELEQENKVLAQNLEDTDIVNKALEKENAELKSGCGMCYRKDKENLTKAKEIIREFVEWATWQGNSKCPSFKNIQNKAEAFLKDSGGK